VKEKRATHFTNATQQQRSLDVKAATTLTKDCGYDEWKQLEWKKAQR
jgi:hypothetical protein